MRNGNTTSFVAFIEYLILVMDNAAIHTAVEAEIVKDLLWDMAVDGRPLNMLVVYLPAPAPELNPIELVFHSLAC
jgi:transposase